MADIEKQELVELAGDALYRHRLVRWVLDQGDQTVVVFNDGREFELHIRLIEIKNTDLNAP